MRWEFNRLKETMRKTQKLKNNPIQKWAKDMNRHFSKEHIQIANKHLRYSTSLTISEIQIKTTVRHHLKSIRMILSKKMQFGIGQTGSPVSLSLNWYIPKKKKSYSMYFFNVWILSFNTFLGLIHFFMYP